jgi:Coenzyme PQQ synthesis protein D (PqqD)
MTGIAKLRDDVVWREVLDEIIVLDQASWRYLTVRGAGVTLWPGLVGGATLGQLADRLVERFGIDRGLAGADVTRFVGLLGDRGLLAA